MATVPAATGAEYQTHLVGPGASFVIACEGATGVSTGSGPVSNTCTFTVTAATVAPNTQVGTETIHIDLAAAAGSSLSQTGQYCGTIPPLSTTPTCLPTGLQDVSTIGNGSCVGSGQTVNPLGGCLSASGLPTLPGTTTSPSPSNSAGGTTPTPSSSSGTGGNGSGSSGGKGGVAAASTTPFTGGPVHPFPVAATGLALGGLALAFAAAFGPAVNRRLRRSAVRKDSH
ncbi:MAG: hypothetical protein JOY68_01965 [Candidatus Dormibacteraeota bacterium]|nr:hypothetical protein [Candidatus Dormibacteraeota bacterium]